ncbi:MAG: hypothetical protein RIF36_04525 [Imperialibacter sp.]|uniref:WapI family immunity protein n=1 Tax=Imperialibacter sp. TaxID=2038411 RepID=UPI0032EC1A89
MNIKIGSNTDYLEITDIVPEGQEFGYSTSSVEFLRGTLCLKVSGVKTDIRASFMIGEIKQLLTNLEQLYRTLKLKFEFQNLEDNVLLKFSPTLNGQIEIDGKLRTQNYSATIDFMFETDQTFLPNTIEQIRDMLAALAARA